MKKNYLKVVFACFLFLFLSSGTNLFAQNKYVGAAKCKMCHNSEASGLQFKIWSESKHANSMASLSNEKSIEWGKKNNVADPSKDPKCLDCHSTFGPTNASLIEEGYDFAANHSVSCESCHGPGSVYKAKSIMMDLAKSKENGLIEPDQKVCERCHNNPANPFMKPFDYETARKKIAHPKI